MFAGFDTAIAQAVSHEDDDIVRQRQGDAPGPSSG